MSSFVIGSKILRWSRGSSYPVTLYFFIIRKTEVVRKYMAIPIGWIINLDKYILSLSCCSMAILIDHLIGFVEYLCGILPIEFSTQLLIDSWRLFWFSSSDIFWIGLHESVNYTCDKLLISQNILLAVALGCYRSLYKPVGLLCGSFEAYNPYE